MVEQKIIVLAQSASPLEGPPENRGKPLHPDGKAVVVNWPSNPTRMNGPIGEWHKDANRLTLYRFHGNRYSCAAYCL